MPYNYLLDGKIRAKMDLLKQDSIIIFDEAHNIESVCEDGASFELSISDLENCVNDGKILYKKRKKDKYESSLSDNSDIDDVMTSIQEFSNSDIDDVMTSIQALKRNFIDWKTSLAKLIESRSHAYYLKYSIKKL